MANVYLAQAENHHWFVAARRPNEEERQMASLILGEIAPGSGYDVPEINDGQIEDARLPGEYRHRWIAFPVAGDWSREIMMRMLSAAGTVEVTERPITFAEIRQRLGDDAPARLFGMNGQSSPVTAELPRQ